MMFIALGILEKDGNVLICRRDRTSFCGNMWEFPATVVEHGETIEDSLERWFFESTGLRCVCEKMYPAFDGPSCRVFPVKMKYLSGKIDIRYYKSYKIARYWKLNSVKMPFLCVIFIKRNKKI